MKDIDSRLYIDSWRAINKSLFKAYIDCYQKLANEKALDPKKTLVEALEANGVRGNVKEKDYGAAYVPARELGIFYEKDGHYLLGHYAGLVSEGKMSYEDYMKVYCLNYLTVINNVVLSPLMVIVKQSLGKGFSKTKDEIFNDCQDNFSSGVNNSLAKSALNRFLGRACESELLQKTKSKFSVKNDIVYEDSVFNRESISPEDFKAKYYGGSKENHANYVTQMINKIVPSNVFAEENPIDKKYDGPLNQILYGPPGTGKTYTTITRALDIIGVSYDDYPDAQDKFRLELGKRIEFVTMHQSFSYEDFVQGLKPQKSEDGTSITFDYKNGVFKEICRRAHILSKEFEIHRDPTKKIDFDVVFNYSFKSFFELNEPVVISRGSTNFKIININDRTLKFETSTGNSGPTYNLSKETLRKIYERGTNDIILSGNKGYFDSLLDFLNQNAQSLKTSKFNIGDTSDKKEPTSVNHVIILDEINRANISRVFGELIALIEEDKRGGKLFSTLPSGEQFTVPENLYIIGTMNTADKSIALVDIALRRRFRFEALYPDAGMLRTVLENKGVGEDEINKRVYLMEALNAIVRAKKSVDFEIGHSYFMSAGSLEQIIEEQILPLLSEYFMYDLKAVKNLLEKPQKDHGKNTLLSTGILFDKAWFADRGLLRLERQNDNIVLYAVPESGSSALETTETEIDSAD